MFVPMSVLEFRDRAARYFGDKIGVIDGERCFTYSEYAERTHRLASGLRRLGLQPGDRVSFITYNTHQLLEAYYGVLEAGGVLNPINIRLAPEEIGFILEHAGSRFVVYHSDFAPLVAAVAPRLSADPTFVVMEGQPGGPAAHEYEALLAAASPDEPPAEVDENAVAELFYTSGTTGSPKGVALTHRALYLHALQTAASLRPTDADTILHVVPLFHVNGWGTPHWMTMVGGTHVMLRRFDPAAFLSLIEQHRVTYLLAVPTVFNAVLAQPDLEQRDLSSLRYALVGGAPSSPQLIRTLEERLGLTALVGYGLSETSPVLTIAWPRQHLLATEPPERRLERQSTTGWALPGVAIRVVDWQGHDVPADGATLGEIIVRSNVVMEGYYRDSAATADKIRDGWFHTGDMATVDEQGYLTIKDRSKDIIISGGENISSVEIENALYAHPAVFECAVVAAPDDTWGEVPVAIVALRPGSAATAQELAAHCREHLAAFKVPRRFEFRDQLPKTGTGKLMKGALREPFWEGQEKRVH
ncbi:MAG: fatty acid--CoA ligase [Candidatus Limnocylindrales bacterium]